MISRTAKATFYAALGPVMKINGALYKSFRAPASGNKKTVRVQLGPGQTNYLKGWINVDANIFTGKADVWADLRNPLPFKDNSVDFLYSHHMMEHLPDLDFHFNEVYRCLKPGGSFRIACPNGDTSIRKFLENDLSWFSDFPRNRKSIGGRFENYLMCNGEHLTIITFSFMKELADNAGFVNLKSCLPVRETFHPEHVGEAIFKMEFEDDWENPKTLVIEADKPKK
jgi:predicted SAM-dependent methyltransferase